VPTCQCLLLQRRIARPCDAVNEDALKLDAIKG